MCDSGLVVVAVLTLMFTFIAIQSIFYSFDYNCNNFYYDDVVGLVSSFSSLCSFLPPLHLSSPGVPGVILSNFHFLVVD